MYKVLHAVKLAEWLSAAASRPCRVLARDRGSRFRRVNHLGLRRAPAGEARMRRTASSQPWAILLVSTGRRAAERVSGSRLATVAIWWNRIVGSTMGRAFGDLLRASGAFRRAPVDPIQPAFSSPRLFCAPLSVPN
jgi:hypothetical protein